MKNVLFILVATLFIFSCGKDTLNPDIAIMENDLMIETDLRSSTGDEDCECQIKVNSLTNADLWSVAPGANDNCNNTINSYFGLDDDPCCVSCPNLSQIGVWYPFSCDVPDYEYIDIIYGARYYDGDDCTTAIDNLLDDPCTYTESSVASITVRCKDLVINPAPWNYKTFTLNANPNNSCLNHCKSFILSNHCKFHGGRD